MKWRPRYSSTAVEFPTEPKANTDKYKGKRQNAPAPPAPALLAALRAASGGGGAGARLSLPPPCAAVVSRYRGHSLRYGWPLGIAAHAARADALLLCWPR
jgi:hypothetical protein